MTLRDEVFWYAQKSPQEGVALKEDLSVDAVVVGGGVGGLTAAEHLARQGLSVALVEREFCGSGASGRSSGFITPDSELELSDILRTYGQEKGKRLWSFVEGGVHLIQDNIKRHAIACDFRIQDSLYSAIGLFGGRNVRAEHSARQRLGYSSRLYDISSLSQVIGSSAYSEAVRYPATFGINTYQYCQGMSQVLQQHGVRIFEYSPVTAIRSNGVQVGKHRITARSIVVCTDRFIPELNRLVDAIYHVQTFLAVSQPLTKVQIQTIFPQDPLMVWDTKVIYNYFRLIEGNRVLMGGANLFYTYTQKEHHHPSHMIRHLDRYWKNIFPHVEVEWEYIWPGMLGVSKDFLPIAGRDREMSSVYYAGAAAGLPWAAALGQHIAQKISGSVNSEFDADFSPYRRSTPSSSLDRFLGAPASFALAHGLAKYVRKFF
jgi:gamma-glutamylputrescine oxidase